MPARSAFICLPSAGGMGPQSARQGQRRLARRRHHHRCAGAGFTASPRVQGLQRCQSSERHHDLPRAANQVPEALRHRNPVERLHLVEVDGRHGYPFSFPGWQHHRLDPELQQHQGRALAAQLQHRPALGHQLRSRPALWQRPEVCKQPEWILDRIVSGWSINGITTLQTGRPLCYPELAETRSTNYGAGHDPPQLTMLATRQSAVRHSRAWAPDKWFDTACFTAVSAYAMGNAPRSSPLDRRWKRQLGLHGAEDHPDHRTTNVSFRVESFNIFNRRAWGSVTRDITNPGFGTVSNQSNSPRQVQASLRFVF